MLLVILHSYLLVKYGVMKHISFFFLTFCWLLFLFERCACLNAMFAQILCTFALVSTL